MERKKVLVTGASRGIGAACAILLAEKGYDLYLTCRQNFTMLTEVREQISAAYQSDCRIFTCDAGDAVQVCDLFKQIDRLDVLVNNVGQAYMGLADGMTAEQWQAVINTNLNSVFYTCREAIPGMVRRKAGKIVNISSVWGAVGASMEVAYSTAKAGVDGFTRALAKELAPSNIQVNALAPGLVDTDMNRELTAAEWEELLREIPVGRAAAPEEAARMVWQIINAPAYLTGQIIRMDGGWK